MQKREFLKKSALLFSVPFLPASLWALRRKKGQLRTAHIGVGNMGMADLKAISSHAAVKVTALCDIDSQMLAKASAMFPEAKTYSDYRVMLQEMGDEIDGVTVSTPDHTHAPASMMAMEMGKHVYCQKPLTHHVMEARAMRKKAAETGLTTQMGIQVHSFYDYKLATLLIQDGIIGKVKTVRAWSPKNWGYDGPAPTGSDQVPENLDWNLWLGTAPERPYKKDMYHTMNWRKVMDYGCGTLGDMGVHIFDTPYNALQLDVPKTIKTKCRKPTDFGFPENNTVTYTFPQTPYTTDKFKWVWYDGPGAPKKHKELKLPNKEALPEQGAMSVGEDGRRLLLPHFMQLPRLIVDGEYVDISDKIEELKRTTDLGGPTTDYGAESNKHYHQWVDACLGNDECTAPFSYAARLTETILLGVIAGRFPNKTLHWNNDTERFDEEEANEYLDAVYRKF